jgi:DHA2 family multidrug resistance protein-like MFS transporter
LSETSTEFGGALGIAILGSVGTAVYHYQVTGHFPRGLPGPAARAIGATLGDATTTAGQLQAHEAAEVLASARGAFTSGVDVVAGVSAIIVAALAVVAVARLRRVTSADEDAGAGAGTGSEADATARGHGHESLTPESQSEKKGVRR